MTIVIPNGFAQITLNWSGAVFDSGKAATVFGITFDAGTLNDLAIAVEGQVSTLMLPEVNGEVTLDTVVAVTDTAVGVQSSGTVGGRSGDMSPPNCCPLLKLNTGLRGRSHRGRWYPPGLLNDGDVEDTGRISTIRHGNLTAMFADLIVALTADNGPLVILHNSEEAPDPVTGAVLETQIATQRRRLR